MHMYNCNRCGKHFGSSSAIRMHLRKVHFYRAQCDYCGAEVHWNQMQEHVESLHPFSQNLPAIYKPPLQTKLLALKPVQNAEEKSFWEHPDVRLSCFTAPETSLKCRLCGKTFGGVHGREQHERDIHKFTTQVKSSLLRLQSWNILDHLKPCDVSDYIDRDLKTPLGGTTLCNDDVNILVNFLITETPLEVTHVVRGGSYGKGTCVKGHSDIDMVMFIEGLPLFGGTRSSAQRLSFCLHDVKRRLQDSLLGTRILISEITSHSLRFQYKCVKNDHIHHVDLMPCNDLLGPKPTTEDKKALYELIANCKSHHELQLLNSSLLQLQVDFVRPLPRIVHDLIRLVKIWRRTSFGEETSMNSYRRLPNSYTLELITIYAWEKHGKPLKFKLRHGLASVLSYLVNYENLCVCWHHNYNKHCRWLGQTLLTNNRPIVVDPANPLNNVCESTNSWDEVALVARQSLKKPLFKNMKILKKWT